MGLEKIKVRKSDNNYYGFGFNKHLDYIFKF